MLIVCNGKNKKWCPLKSECDEYHPRELLDGEETKFSCVDENGKYHKCKYIEDKK